MIVYVEYVIFDNFLMDLFIGLLLSELLRFRKLNAIVSAIIGTALALIFPTVEINHIIIYKFLTLFCCCIPFCGKSLYEYFKSIICYSIISFLYAGSISLLFGLDGSFISFSDGLKVGIISFCCVVGYFVILKIIKTILAKTLKGDFCQLKVIIENKKISAIGFFDSGNCALASDGNGIVFLDKKISKNIKGKSIDFVLVSTVSGEKIVEVYKINEIEIYVNGEKHMYKNVNAVKTGQTYNGFQVLLSTKLKEIRYER